MSLSTVLYCRPSDILTASATLSFTAGAAAAAFPLTNVQDGKAHTVFKSTGTGCTIRSTFGAAKTIQGLALAFHKLVGATCTVTNAAGFSKVLTIPANTRDGHCLDPWDDYRGLPNTTSNVWDIAITGAATVCAIGEILWIETLREMLVNRGATSDDDQPAIVHPTDYHPHARVYGMGTRVRTFRARVEPADVAADMLVLHQDARGPLLPFVLIPDSTVNDALHVHLRLQKQRFVEALARGSGAREVDVDFVESLRGLSL